MIQAFLIAINEWMAGGIGIAALGCFLWGMVSVALSPCHMASIPLIVSYVAGQERGLRPRSAAFYAAAFTVGLFITIAVVGIACALLGRMLGDVGPWWTLLVGAILIWVALDMLGVKACSMSGTLMARLRVRGMTGAFALGLAYGVLSGSCTFGFIAPILAVITIQEKIATGILFITLFGIGHCIPIAVAGSSTALVRRVLENSRFQQSGIWFRRLAGVAIFVLGGYFIVRPFLAGA
ncbi:cytochrome c biogenesis CcdA family protein [Desulfosudis oleivorans]|uniref:Cytochrome c biogenesis protein transmembrane region n=1 Tax=Desulfosudis oleivorans (strain DSM 6200 / JCM 39069 / Hxd3) TaxID=96561 RepID=A8ZYG5_DESOH|nr:cytochrome c biogenesis protein CcdA [Desulfosudis oleivorans]ABW68690.1 cytochrome c biogenesis protein transmembrane region [Desulfosudis oleivorans Hxd3]